MLHRVLKEWSTAREPFAAGVMVGTSLDGLDACIVELPGDGPGLMPTLRGGCSVPFTRVDVARVREIAEGRPTTARELAELADALAADHADAVREAARRCGVDAQRLRYVAAHGVTLSHRPRGDHPHSWQLLNAEALAVRLNSLVCADFRSSDVAAGGQGAPLAPVVDRRLRASADRDRIVLNLGGIANVSLLPAGAQRVWAADVGPANMPLDLLWRIEGREGFDRDGESAGRGNCIDALLRELLAEPWIRQPLPRSFGREEFGRGWVEALRRRSKGASLADRLATVVALEAEALRIFVTEIAPAGWRRAAAQPIELLITGGGVHNRALFGAFAKLEDMQARSLAEIGEDPDLKEAFDFAALGWLRLAHEHSTSHESTGATQDLVLGSIHFPDGRRA